MESPRQLTQRRYRERHPDRVRESDAKWRRKNPEHARQLGLERARRYNETHHEEIKAKRKAKYRRGVERPRMTDVEVATVEDLYSQGLNFKQIGERMRRSPLTVAARLRMTRDIPRPLAKRGPGAPGWKGGRCIDSQGYALVRVPIDDEMYVMAWKSGVVPEHRLMLARKLGRPLLQSETAHHINGDKLDNRSENLQLRQGKHGKGVVMRCSDCGSHHIIATDIAEN